MLSCHLLYVIQRKEVAFFIKHLGIPYFVGFRKTFGLLVMIYFLCTGYNLGMVFPPFLLLLFVWRVWLRTWIQGLNPSFHTYY